MAFGYVFKKVVCTSVNLMAWQAQVDMLYKKDFCKSIFTARLQSSIMPSINVQSNHSTSYHPTSVNHKNFCKHKHSFTHKTTQRTRSHNPPIPKFKPHSTNSFNMTSIYDPINSKNPCTKFKRNEHEH